MSETLDAERDSNPQRQAEHSDLPWSLEGEMKIVSGVRYVANLFLDGTIAGDIPEHKANATYIVEACNNYPKLLAELGMAKATILSLIESLNVYAKLLQVGSSPVSVINDPKTVKTSN